MKIWIIWSNWFLWQALLKKFLSRGDCSLYTFDRSAPKEHNILINSYFWDIISNPDSFRSFINHDYDVLIHLWERPTYDLDYLLSKQLYYNKIIFDFISLNKSIKTFIYLSSMAVYWSWLDKKESDKLLSLNNYWFVKKISEKIFLDLIDFGKKVIIFRPSNLYWVWSNSWVIHNFISNINNNKEIKIYWDWNQKREFFYIEDCVDAIEKSINFESSDIFNISWNELASLNDLIKMLKEIYHKDIEVIYLPVDELNSPQALSENIEHAKKSLNWEPKTSLLNWLRKTVWKRST